MPRPGERVHASQFADRAGMTSVAPVASDITCMIYLHRLRERSSSRLVSEREQRDVFASTKCAPQVDGSVRSRSLHRTGGSGLLGQSGQSDWNRWLWNAQHRSDWVHWL